jgi:hypothetical protein
LEFATVEVIWLWQFGAPLEALLGPNARGNRLKLLDSRREFNKDALGCFKFWPVAYREFREQGFAVARELLNKAESDVWLPRLTWPATTMKSIPTS